jgi:hypothetical protein
MSESSSIGLKEWQLACFKAIAKSWADPGFKDELKKNPHKALKSKPIGLDISDDTEIRVVEASETEQAKLPTYSDGWTGTPLLLVLPAAPKIEDQAVALAQLVELSQSDTRCCGGVCCC